MLGLNLLFLLTYVFLYFYIYKKYAVLMIVFFYLFYGYLSMVVSVFYLDFGDIYAFEVGKKSVKSNSLLVMGSFYVSSIMLFLFWYIRRERRLISSVNLIPSTKRFYLKPAFILGFLWFSFFFIAIIYLHLFYSGVPIFLGYAKGVFWSYARFPFFQTFHNQTSTVLAVLGFYYGYITLFRSSEIAYVKYTKYFKLVLFIYILYIVLMGYKFGGPLLYLFSFYLPFLIFYSFSNKLNLRGLFKYLFLFALFITPVIWYVYYEILGLKDGAWALIFDRIFALQGQVWHFIYHEISVGDLRPDISQLWIELKNSIFQDNIKNTGMNHLMHFIMPQERLTGYLEQGVRLSGGYPAYLLVIFKNKLVIILFHIIVTWLVFCAHFNFLLHLVKLNLIKFILWLKIALLSKGILFMGDLDTILSFKMVFYLFLVVVIFLFEESISNRKKALNN